VIDERYFLDSVDRVMQVLNCFSLERPELRLADLSEQLDMHKTQVRRIASTLESGGYLIRDPETKRYRLGMRFLQLGMIARAGLDIRRVALPHLRRLVEETRETARLIVPNDSGPICIDLIESPQSIRVFAQLGSVMPWHAGTSPKLILAYLPPEHRERIIAGITFVRYTERTITDADALRAELDQIRGQDVYVAAGDLDREAAGVSAPIFDYHGSIVGTVSISGPTTRITGDEFSRFIELVRGAGRSISADLGYTAVQHDESGPARYASIRP
jgi:DNA-binding IclR family transcriptional regulator